MFGFTLQTRCQAFLRSSALPPNAEVAEIESSLYAKKQSHILNTPQNGWVSNGGLYLVAKAFNSSIKNPCLEDTPPGERPEIPIRNTKLTRRKVYFTFSLLSSLI